MPYTSRDEITTAVEACVTDFMENGNNERCAITFSLASVSTYFILFARSTITERDIDNHLMISQAGSPPLDILVRTSGVNRLSDFLLWQVRSNLMSVLYQLIDFLYVVSAVKRHNCSLYPLIGLNLVSLTSSLSSWIINGKYGTVAYLSKHCT